MNDIPSGVWVIIGVFTYVAANLVWQYGIARLNKYRAKKPPQTVQVVQPPVSVKQKSA